jgi:kynureninase
LKQVHAVLEYYQQHQQEVEEYMAAWRSQKERLQAEQNHNPSPGIARLRKLKEVYTQANQAVETK